MRELFSHRVLYTLLAVTFLLLSFSCFSARTANENFYSPKSKQLYCDLSELYEKSGNISFDRLIPNEMKEKYGIRREGDELYVNGKIEINSQYNESNFSANGITVNSSANNFINVSIPLSTYLKLDRVPGIDYVEIESEDSQQYWSYSP